MPSSHRGRALSLLLLLAAAGCGGKQAEVPAAPPAPDDVAAAANRVLELYEQGYEVVSATALAPLYLPGVETTVVVQGKAHRGSTQVEAYLTELFTRVEAFRLDLGKVTVAALGDATVEIGAELRREYREGSVTVVENGVLSMTLSRVGDKWLIRTEHFSYGR